MSIWYQYDVTVLGDRAAIGKFFNLDPKEDIHYIERFEFSFGQVNGPGLRLGKLVHQNPDLIFLVKESVEVDCVTWWIERFNEANNEMQHIFLYTNGSIERKINKKILIAYDREHPGLSEKHIAGKKGYEEFRWGMFFRFEKAANMLKSAKDYKEKTSLPRLPPRFEQDDPHEWTDNFDHLEDK